MALFGRRESAQAAAVAEPPPVIHKPELPPSPTKQDPEDDFCLPLDPEPPGTPRQRGLIGEARAALERAVAFIGARLQTG